VLPALSGAPGRRSSQRSCSGHVRRHHRAGGVAGGDDRAGATPRRVIGLVTVAFGIGQIIGPLAAGWLLPRPAATTGADRLPRWSWRSARCRCCSARAAAGRHRRPSELKLGGLS